MKFSELKRLARLYSPGAKTNKISNATLELLLNEGAARVAVMSKCLKTNEKFTVTAETQSYDLSSVVTRFAAMDTPGLLWNAGDADDTDWDYLDPITIKWLDKNRSSWRDEDSGSPIYYAQEGDNLIIVPTPDTTLANGFWLYYAQKPKPMTSDDHYPFGYDTEISRLSIFADAVIKFFTWKSMEALAKRDQTDLWKAEQDFYREVAQKTVLLNRRPDVSHYRRTKFQGKVIR